MEKGMCPGKKHSVKRIALNIDFSVFFVCVDFYPCFCFVISFFLSREGCGFFLSRKYGKNLTHTYNIDLYVFEQTLTLYPLCRDNGKRLWSMTNTIGPPV